MAGGHANPHGPRFVSTLDHLSNWLIIGWLLGGALWLLTSYIFHRHADELLSHPRASLRSYYLRVASIPIVFSTTSMATLIFPRPAFMFELFRAVWESYCLIAFGHIMVELMGIMAVPGGGYASEEEHRNRALSLAAKVKPLPYWGAPPLGCCFRRCLKPVPFDSRMLTWSRRCVSQFIYVKPLMGVINLWIQVDDSSQAIYDKTGFTDSSITGFFETLSMLLAMQGLFMIYWCCRKPLADWNVGLKFVALKLVIFLTALQSLALSNTVATPDEDAFYDKEARTQFWNAGLLLVECAGASLLMWAAFPKKELVAAEEMRVKGKVSAIEVTQDSNENYGAMTNDQLTLLVQAAEEDERGNDVAMDSRDI